MSSQFTPGPWKFIRDESGNGDEVFGFDVSAANGRSIAYYDADDDPQTEANARPIAAAPELYATLGQILENTDYGVIQPRYTEEAHAALRKARGEP